MPGTKAGAAKARATILERDPEFFSRIGQKGGQTSRGGGFASLEPGSDGLTGPERASKYGVYGGRKSRRGPAKPKQQVKQAEPTDNINRWLGFRPTK